jgi:hypothetical protein
MMVLGILTVVGATLYSFATWTAGIRVFYGIEICATLEPYIGLLKVLSCLDSVVTLVLPSVSIIAMNGRIGVKIYRYMKGKLVNKIPSAGPSSRTESEGGHNSQGHVHMRRLADSKRRTRTAGVNERFTMDSVPNRLMETASGNIHVKPAVPVTRPRACSWHNLQNMQVYRRKFNSQMRITRMLFFTSSVFVLLNLPSHAFRMYAFMVSLRNQEYKISGVAFSIQELMQFFYYLSFATNLFLYNACSKTFRAALKILWRRMKYKCRNAAMKINRLVHN